MLKELFDAVNKAAVTAAIPSVIQWNPQTNFVHKNAEGGLVFHEAKPAIRQHTLASIDDLAQFAHEHAVAGVCFYDDGNIRYFIDDATRLDSVNVELHHSPQMLELLRLDEKPGTYTYTQKDLIWALRTIFKKCLPDKKILEAIRSCKLDQEAKRESEIQRGKSSVGNAIMKQFVGLADIPEYVTFQVPVWSGPVQYVVDIECILDPEENSGNFLLKPLPGECDRALTAAQEELGKRLAIALGDGFLLYNGTP